MKDSWIVDSLSKLSEQHGLERERFNEDFMDYAEDAWNEALYEYSIAEQESEAIENAILEELASKLYEVLFRDDIRSPKCFHCARPLSMTEDVLCDDCAEDASLFVAVRHFG